MQDKEKLLTDLRKILNITNDQHFKFLEEVTEDKLVTRLREARSNPVEQPVAPSYAMPPPRQNPNHINRKSSRPSSGGLKITPSPTAGSRPSRYHHEDPVYTASFLTSCYRQELALCRACCPIAALCLPERGIKAVS